MSEGNPLASETYRLDTLDAGLQALLMFLDRDSVTVTSVSESLGMARSQAHRILSTLKGRGLVTSGPAGRGYYPGPLLVDIARPLVLDLEFRRRIRPVLEDAAKRTGETVHVAVLLGSQALIFDGQESDQSVRVSSRVGLLRPAHATSAGKLLLSRLVPDQILALFPHEQLPRFTPRTVATRTELLAELERLREQDYALNRQEIERGVNGAAVVLAGTNWRNRVSLLASVPADRGDDEALKNIAQQLQESANLLVPLPE